MNVFPSSQKKNEQRKLDKYSLTSTKTQEKIDK